MSMHFEIGDYVTLKNCRDCPVYEISNIEEHSGTGEKTYTLVNIRFSNNRVDGISEETLVNLYRKV